MELENEKSIVDRFKKVPLAILIVGFVISFLLLAWSAVASAIGCTIVLILSILKIRRSKVAGIVMTVLSALLALLLLLYILAMLFVDDRVPLSANQFASEMNSAGYGIVDITSQYEDISAQRVLAARSADYQIEYYVFLSEDTAQRVFDKFEAVFEAAKSSPRTSARFVVNNYGHFTLTSNQTYHVVAYIEHTLISAVVPNEYKKEVNDVITALGYLGKDVERERDFTQFNESVLSGKVDTQPVGEKLTLDSDNWEHFFQEQKDDRAVQFARRFVIAKTDDNVTTGFFDDYGSNATGNLFFLHDKRVYYIAENEKNNSIGVIHEDLVLGDSDFSFHRMDVKTEIPSDYVIARTQTALDLFKDLLPDYNGTVVSADIFNSAETVDSAMAMFNQSRYTVRDDGFSQVSIKVTGEDTDLMYTMLVLIYKDDELFGALFAPANYMQDGLKE